ncbi:hypothetical protein RUM4293_00117 [Ruegeria atlantica]|uniref:NAD-specific glutamate dehydrogenase n=1 Tax=Ruegeria atlantica TaxID=81569 RepID=A0A0P1E0P5_9RHOB|nr:hypothetical protein RUM4293_00117 [Ruegeria atlantica]
MGGVFQRVVLRVDLAVDDVLRFGPDGQHGVAEAVQLILGFRLGWLDHQGAGHRPGHGGRVEAGINQTLGDVVDADLRRLVQGSGVEDAFMRHTARVRGVEDRIGLLQACRDVVGVQDCHFRGLRQTGAAHQQHIGPADRQNGRRAEGRGRDRTHGSAVFRVAGQVLGQMRLDADRTHAGAAAAMRDAEGLVQVQVADVTANVTRTRQADHGVHVGAVDIDLTAVIMGDLADLLNGGLEHAMGRGVGDHAGGQMVRMLFRLGAEVGQIDIALVIGLHRHNLIAHHLRRGRVGAMRRGRDQADIAVPFAAGEVIVADGQQACVFTLRARVGLLADRVIAGDLAQLVVQIINHLMIALRLIFGAERVQIAELGPGDRDHLDRGVQLHGAGPQRNHRPVQRQVAVGQTAHIARDLGLGPVLVEDLVGQVRAFAQRVIGQAIDFVRAVILAIDTKGTPDGLDGLGAGLFVQADAHLGLTHLAQVDAPRHGGLHHDILQVADLNRDGVEEHLWFYGKACLFQTGGQARGLAVHRLRDGLDAVGAVIHGIHRGNDGQQRLRGADIRVGFLAANVLLAGLQRQAVSLVAARVDRHADDPAGHRPLQLVTGRHIGRVRAAIAHRHAKALGRADGNIRAHLAGGFQQRQRQDVGGNNGNGFVFVQGGDLVREVAHMAVGAGILEDRAKDRPCVQRVRVGHLHVDAQRLGAGFDHRDGLRVAVLVHEESRVVGLRPATAFGHRHRFGSSSRLVQKRGIGHVQPGQVADHGLEVQQRLKTALADLGLVGRIGGVPGRVFQDVAQDRRRRGGAIVPLADQRGQNLVLARHLFHVKERIAFGHRRTPVQRLFLPDRRRDGGVDQLVQRLEANHLEHVAHFRRAGPDMAAVGEVIGFVVGQFEGHRSCSSGNVSPDRSGRSLRRGVRAVPETVRWTVSGPNGRSPNSAA